jgi:hypothetical protein
LTIEAKTASLKMGGMRIADAKINFDRRIIWFLRSKIDRHKRDEEANDV